MEQLPKKRGRPSKADVLAREQQKIQLDNKLKEELIATSSSLEFPLFKYNDTVKKISALVISDYNPSGTVIRQDLNSQYVFVSWHDGTQCWNTALGLVKVIPVVKKKRKEKS